MSLDLILLLLDKEEAMEAKIIARTKTQKDWKS